MAINSDFKHAVDTDDIRLTRIMLKDSLILDPTFREFDELNLYAKSQLPGLYDEHNGEALHYDITAWNKDYLNEQMVQVVYNFSNERIDLLKNMCRHIYADRIEEMKKQERDAKYQPSATKKEIGAGMVVGGTAAAAVGVAVSQPVIVTVGVVIAVTGGVIYYQNR